MDRSKSFQDVIDLSEFDAYTPLTDKKGLEDLL